MLRALFLTVIIECCTAWVLGVRSMRDQTTVMLANVLTNPLVVSAGAAVQFFMGYEYLLPAVLAMEIAAVAAEGLVYRGRLSAGTHPFMLSMICNLISYTAGEILNRLVF